MIIQNRILDTGEWVRIGAVQHAQSNLVIWAGILAIAISLFPGIEGIKFTGPKMARKADFLQAE